MNSSIIVLPTEQAFQTKITLDQVLSTTRTVVETSAVILSDVITISLLTTLNAGVATRRWWELDGKNLAKEIGWTILRTLGMIVLGLACLICVIGFALTATWHASKTAWAWINRATDDGLGLYGESPMLAQWVAKFSPTPVITKTDASNVPPLNLPGTDLIQWAQNRWPQLKEMRKG